MENETNRKAYNILVVGDVVVDHHIYRDHCKHPTAKGKGTRIIPKRGGAGQTAKLLNRLCEDVPLLDIHDKAPKLAKKTRVAPGAQTSYATWTPFPQKKTDDEDTPKVWRVNETFGFGVVETPAEDSIEKDELPEPSSYDVVVIDEGGLCFRSKKEDWPDFLKKKPFSDNQPWIVLKMSHLVCQGDLWTQLKQSPFCDRLIVIVSADDLRRSGASVSMGLSWEKSVRELLSDLKFDAELRQLSQAKHVIVNFGHDGALWVDNTNPEEPNHQLVFDPGHLEGNWEEDLEGTVLGAGSCLPASVVWSLFTMKPAKGIQEDDEENVAKELWLTEGQDLGTGIARGIAARRALMEAGHGTTDSPKPGFPYKPVISILKGPRSGDLSSVAIPDFAIPAKPGDSDVEGSNWSIIAGASIKRDCPLFGRARKVARFGEAALEHIPYGRFKDLYTVDRIEMNSYFGLRKLMMDYIGKKKAKKPMSIGVFGPPGSGKSFGIKQIARGILGEDVPILTFNLSQFSEPEMIIGALHQVRDQVLKGEVPVVFWDEFDSKQNYWLKFMLAPMNDGEFLESQVTHPVGKCIFIFAGGTSDSLQEFSTHDDPVEKQKFKNDKGPDFVSRLNGYLNVLGPNPRQIGGKNDPTDVGYPIRRAIMLRVNARKFKSKELTIDDGLLNAMLKVSKFKHGTRSMANIIELTTGGGKRELLRCNLPPREQLGLHVEYDEFLDLVHEGTMFKLNDKELAPHIHQFYLDLAEKEGRPPKYPQPWDEPPPNELPLEIQGDNYAAARRLPDVLALVGLMVVDDEAGSGENEELVNEIIIENLELLAEAEHDGWMDHKLKNDWSFADIRNDEKKHHNCLIPYRDLNPEDKAKDRDSVKNYPEIVKRAGFLIKLERCIK